METIRIHGTDLIASRVALGTWAIGGWMWGGSDEQESIRTIQSALETGINLIDTAPVYGSGRSEELVGRALVEGGRRHKALIATKCGLVFENPPRVTRDSSRQRIMKEAEDSLRRLKTDVIDIYQIHWPDTSVPFAETAEAMNSLFKAGKIRAIGVSNYSPQQMDEFRKIAPLHTVQPPYNLFERGIERDVLPYARQHEIAMLMYGPLCRGLLSGRMHPDTKFEGDDLRKADPKFKQPRFGQYLEAVRKLDEFAQKNYGKRIIHLAVRWILDQPGNVVALWGARRPQQLDPIPEVMGWKLDQTAMNEIDRIVNETVKDAVGPEFMAPPPAGKRPVRV